MGKGEDRKKNRSTTLYRSHGEPQAGAPPIDKAGTLRNIDWLETDRTRKAEVRVRSE
ncbi:hypothetical protein T06_11369 [Trichinella sp. T6]|nr:hypothetical protein T06_11369 [Trichinella sp. T6]